MKAYYVYLDYGCDRWSVVVFAESAGQAKMEAIRSGYLGDYVEYLALREKRACVKYHRGYIDRHAIMNTRLYVTDVIYYLDLTRIMAASLTRKNRQ